MRLGSEILLTDQRALLKEKRLGLLGHQASLNRQGEHLANLLFAEKKEWQLTTLFGPEHGLTTQAQDMEAVASGIHQPTGLPLYSLYGHSEKALKPQKQMLKEIDSLVVDLQDIGSRYYTYIWTVTMCMEVCGKYKKQIIVCDRPNPINGVALEGEVNEKGYTSFVGLYPLPVRHAMTIGEIARFINDTFDLNCELTVVPMERWKREWYWEDTGLVWKNPSPNMRSPLQALFYPGICLFEGTNISEGRGTDIPFEIVGAPFVKPSELISLLNDFRIEGVQFEPFEFKPAFQKWAGQECFGVRLKVTDRFTFKPYATGIALIWAIYSLYHDKGFQWRMEPYEFVEDVPAIDLLTGSTTVRNAVEKHLPLSEILEWVGEPSPTFIRQRTPYLLY